jgi:hypothetical protein
MARPARRDVDGCHHTSLIPVLVTGIQPPRVCAVNDSSVLKGIFRAMDMALLASL